MEEWKEYRLIDVLDALIDYRGKTPKKTAFGVPLITAKIIKNGRIETPSEFISLNDYDSWMVRGFPKVGDVVLTTEAPLGEVAQLDDANIALAQRVVTLRGKSGVLDNTYLKYYFLSNVGHQRLKARETGTTVTGIKQSELREVIIDVPPYEIQVRISNILKSLDDKIENNRKINVNLEQQAQALFKSWFVDFEPFKNGEFIESELGMIPKGWRVERVENLALKMASGGTPKSLNKDYYSGDIKWFSTKELKDCFLFDSEKHISEDALNNSSAKMFPEGTVLMAIYAAPTVGRLGILTSPATFNQAAVGIVPKENVGSEFIYMSLLSERINLNNLASGAAQQNLNVSIVKNYNILVPEQKVLDEFNRITKSYFTLLKRNANESRRLAELRDTLLPKLMSGELKVI